MNRAPRALALVGDETGCSMWRVWQPFKELERRGFIAEWCHKDESMKVLPLVAAGRYDVVITPRIVWPTEKIGDKWIEAVHKAKLAWIYEIDDDVFGPRIINRQSRLFETERAKGEAQLEWERQERIKLVGQADGVTVTTKRLRTIVQSYVGEDTPVYVVPNAIDVEWFRRVLRGIGRVPELEGKLTIGWAGGARENIDFREMAKGWGIVAERYPDVMFVAQGFLSEVMADCVPKERRVLLPWLSLEEYPRAMVNVDIGCCSVGPMMFNTSKSCIKWYEYTLAGAVCVVSPTLYGREATDEFDCLYAETAEQWATQLGRLVESQDLRRKLQRQARQTVVTDHSLENNLHNWVAAWSDTVDLYREKLDRRVQLSV